MKTMQTNYNPKIIGFSTIVIEKNPKPTILVRISAIAVSKLNVLSLVYSKLLLCM